MVLGPPQISYTNLRILHLPPPSNAAYSPPSRPTWRLRFGDLITEFEPLKLRFPK